MEDLDVTCMSGMQVRLRLLREIVQETALKKEKRYFLNHIKEPQQALFVHTNIFKKLTLTVLPQSSLRAKNKARCSSLL